jgi:hypothetical protein
MNKLNEIPGKNPFKVPDNYFEEVNRKIISEAARTDHDIKKVSFLSRYRNNLLIAASVTGFILLTYTGIKVFSHSDRNTKVSEILNDINPDSFMNDIDISSLESETTILPPQAGPDVSKKEIIDYLLLENIELSDIYEQL